MTNFTGRKDAFGRMLWDFRRGEGDAIEIAERDDGWMAMSAGPREYLAEYKDWPAIQKKATPLREGPCPRRRLRRRASRALTCRRRATTWSGSTTRRSRSRSAGRAGCEGRG